MTEPSRFELNEAAFMEAIEPLPAFIADPSPEYLTAVELMPIVELLVMHR